MSAAATSTPFERLRICPECHELHGEWERPLEDRTIMLYQQCRCERAVAPAEQWPGYDFNLAVDLCRCCGAVPLRSGSRWSVWFCDDCKLQVGLLNGRHGRCVIPIGRHSVHAGHLLTGEALQHPGEVVAFADTMVALFTVMGWLDDWVGIAVARNFDAARLDPARQEVTLPVYLAALASHPPVKDERFRELLAYLQERARSSAHGDG